MAATVKLESEVSTSRGRGQTQHVNLVRAIYSDADIMLMDDPLSAVDAHVGKHILDQAICTFLKDKCRILATHRLHIHYRCDRVLMMKGGLGEEFRLILP
jgi:ATP-binding cassette subfamily C (CFTR/MRP) protein 1